MADTEEVRGNPGWTPFEWPAEPDDFLVRVKLLSWRGAVLYVGLVH